MLIFFIDKIWEAFAVDRLPFVKVAAVIAADFIGWKVKTIHFSFLNHCRPKSVSMGNAIKHIKWNINQIPGTMKDSEVN